MAFELFKRIFRKVDQIVTGRGRIDASLFEELEELLLQADVNIHTTNAVLADLKDAVQDERMAGTEQVIERIKVNLLAVLKKAGGSDAIALAVGPTRPSLYLVVGVNGVGKTTTIAKLAHMLQGMGKKVILAAGDTFRAAAIDQLEIWASRTGTEIIRHKEGADPSAVVYDAIHAAQARGVDYVIADTAGRLHNRSNLMEELKKICRISERELGRRPMAILLVLDATTGQNAISQAKNFKAAVPVTGLVLAKMDGTARGGIVISIADELQIPIKLIGMGEKSHNLETFSPDRFIDGLFGELTTV